MKVAVTGATGVIGTAAVRALVAAGHHVVAMARTSAKAEALQRLGAEPTYGDLFEHEELVSLMAGCDALCNFATRIPVGYAAMRPGAWRENDRLRTEGVRAAVTAAQVAGVRRVVQESVSFTYAGNGDEWVNEQSPLEITPATEPASVGESHVQDYQCDSRRGVVLRFGTIVGDDALTRWTLRAVRNGRPIGLGDPDGWAHLVHTDDLGPAVLAALSAPSGVYNVGAEPVRRRDLVQGYADAVGQDNATFLGGLSKRLAGARVEPLTRSLRVCSEHFRAQSGWTPRRAAFDPSWFEAAGTSSKALR